MPGTTAPAPVTSSPSRGRPAIPEALGARVGSDAVHVDLADGRTISFPIAWSPRLLYATPEERAVVEVAPSGLHWPLLDEDLSVSGILDGRGSEESAESLLAWRERMDRRRAQIARGGDPDPHYPTQPLPDWWEDEPATP